MNCHESLQSLTVYVTHQLHRQFIMTSSGNKEKILVAISTRVMINMMLLNEPNVH